MQEGPVAEHDHMFAIIGDRIGLGGIDHDRPVMALLLLETRVAVIPVGAALQQRKFVNEGGVRLDAWKADARNAVHLKRDNQPVPMDRAVFVESILDMQETILTLDPPNQRRWPPAAHRDGTNIQQQM